MPEPQVFLCESAPLVLLVLGKDTEVHTKLLGCFLVAGGDARSVHSRDIGCGRVSWGIRQLEAYGPEALPLVAWVAQLGC